jgi:hypothetical protein
MSRSIEVLWAPTSWPLERQQCHVLAAALSHAFAPQRASVSPPDQLHSHGLDCFEVRPARDECDLLTGERELDSQISPMAPAETTAIFMRFPPTENRGARIRRCCP